MIELLGVPGGRRCLWDVSELSIVSIPLAWGMFVYSEVTSAVTRYVSWLSAGNC